MTSSKKLIMLLEDLTGEKYSKKTLINFKLNNPFAKDGLSFNQLNELLLMHGFSRIKIGGFFQYLVNGEYKYDSNSRINSISLFEEGIRNFQRLAMIYYGNIKMAYAELSSDFYQLRHFLEKSIVINEDFYTSRPKPMNSLINIPKENTFFLGHLIERDIKNALEKNKDDTNALQLKKERPFWIKKGKINFENYLSFDHMDVYVATSMREKHEYFMINKISDQVFNNPSLKDLNVRFFDPTQAFCENRIDKGLSEALMLKRAKCTLYLVQEIDTLGKDSELASTLAQGKPVIAYVPKGDKKDLVEIKEAFSIMYNKNEKEILLDLLKIFACSLPWEKDQKEIRSWIENNNNIKIEKIEKLVLDKMKIHYDKRADLLKDQHPLGIQVNLATGVANGLMVVRSVDDCASLLRCVLLRELDLKVEKGTKKRKEDNYLFLKETISGSIFRIITAYDLLSNSFWNFYLDSDEEQVVN